MEPVNNKMKQIVVLKFPLTKILIPYDADEQEARTKWLAKYNKKQVSAEQERREIQSVREGKMTQFKNMKR